MSRRRLAALGATAGLVLGGLVPALGQARAPRAATEQTLQRALDGAVNARVPGAVLLARKGNRTIRVASGYAKVRDKTRMRTSDRFRIGSLMTSFVATAVLQLVAEGRLALDDTVESRLPGAIPRADHRARDRTSPG